jgi:drug/metabolite transporter (DMT)-like permease
VLAVVCALTSALLYALASVLQQRSAAAEPATHSLRLGLLARLVHNPIWLVGIGADVLGYALQFVALGRGTLVLVQPLLVSGLLFALPMAAWWSRSPLRRRDWIGAVAVCVGLSVFLVVARPAHGHDDVRTRIWVLLLAAAAVVSGFLVVVALGRPVRQKSMLLSGVAGVIYGVSAALTKTSAHLLSRGVVVLLSHWQPYALVVAGISGMVVAQSAFQAGSLDASLPTMTVVDPVVSIVIGAVAFGESLDTGAFRTLIELVALGVMVAGVFLLGQSKAIQQVHDHPSPP